jgi:hypothetical protein
VSADTVDGTKIKTKVRAANNKPAEGNFELIFIYPAPEPFNYYSYKKC